MRECRITSETQGSKLVRIPLVTHFKISSALSQRMEKEVEHMLSVPYASAVKSIMNVMVCIKPNISHIVSVVSKHINHPKKIHQ